MPSADESTDAVYETTVGPDERASVCVAVAAAAASGRPVDELGPLYDVVDPDALDALVAHTGRTDAPGEQLVAFPYEGFEVQLRGDGRLRLEPGD
ncbi:HalOD1 output domain-containing protein [Salinilacihabitans rarus]|uniref:HalOD1 output domain-containing protein n=1 Tax=Salinilacihabitans rarus TaxID=2961596 RepID=UPI0020C8BD29|nr:HalOD1 output domain-containing protein [Salinilacihabitans rarus]